MNNKINIYFIIYYYIMNYILIAILISILVIVGIVLTIYFIGLKSNVDCKMSKWNSCDPITKKQSRTVLVDQSGNAAVVERSPKEQSVRWSSGEIIFCTNHTVTPYMRIQEKSRGKEGDRNSDMRYDNLIKLTQKDNFRKTLDTMKDILKYHDTFGGICQHGDPSYQGEKQLFYPMVTIRAFINIIKERKLLIANGNPCINDYFEFQFE